RDRTERGNAEILWIDQKAHNGCYDTLIAPKFQSPRPEESGKTRRNRENAHADLGNQAREILALVIKCKAAAIEVVFEFHRTRREGRIICNIPFDLGPGAETEERNVANPSFSGGGIQSEAGLNRAHATEISQIDIADGGA